MNYTDSIQRDFCIAYHNSFKKIDKFLMINNIWKRYDVYKSFSEYDFPNNQVGLYFEDKKKIYLNFRHEYLNIDIIEEIIVHECCHYIDDILAIDESRYMSFHSLECNEWYNVVSFNNSQFIETLKNYEERCYKIMKEYRSCD
jgi:predicted SprT family Zn-dependent metalloprotease